MPKIGRNEAETWALPSTQFQGELALALEMQLAWREQRIHIKPPVDSCSHERFPQIAGCFVPTEVGLEFQPPASQLQHRTSESSLLGAHEKGLPRHQLPLSCVPLVSSLHVLRSVCDKQRRTKP